MTKENNERRYKYEREKLKRIPLDVQKDYFLETLKPAADHAGETVNGYIKKAIAQRIEREKNPDLQ